MSSLAFRPDRNRGAPSISTVPAAVDDPMVPNVSTRGRAALRRSAGFGTVPHATLVRMDVTGTGRPLLTAELLSVGSEITVGDTRDTNAGELARDLTARGVQVRTSS